MKLLLPVGTIFVAAASCCCCGDLGELGEEFGGGSGTDASAWAEEAEKAAEEAPSGGASAGGGVTAGLCGRFQSDGLTLPSGFSVIGCTTSTGSESLLAMGSTPPKELCASMKTWATGAGWSVETEADMSGTVAMIFKNGGSRMSMSCSDTTGQTSIAASITPG